MTAAQDMKLLATRMMRVFQGNKEGHYLADFRNVTIEKGGKRVPVYRDVKGPLRLEEFEDHVQGRTGLLVVPLTQSGACRWGKIDVDDYDGDPIVRAAKWATLIKRLGLPLIAELSKSGGVQLAHYSPYTESADDMRAKLADWCAALHIKPGTEIFPKQGRLLPGEIGSGINLPYLGGDSPECRNYAVSAEGKRLTMKEWLDIIESMPAKATHVPGQVNVEAAADLLSKYWTDGNRDNLNLAVAGTLLRAGLDTDTVQMVLDACMGTAVDEGKHANALQVELMMNNGKKVPGFPKLAEYIGQEDAAEFMRLAGGRPPPELLPFNFSAIEPLWLSEKPAPVTYCVEPLLPRGVVGLLVAEGGAGKTSFGMRMAISIAGGRQLFDLPTTQGRVVYIACEEQEAGLRRRLFWIVERERQKMRDEKLSAEAIELFDMNLLTNLTLRSAVGYEMYLISAKNGEAAQTGLVEALLEKLPRPLELLVLDPISRLNGAEENSNAVGTSLINAAERIAREAETTVLLCHHTGKSAAKDRDAGLYAARGASGFVDAARSSIRLLAADGNDVRNFTNVPNGVVEAGDLIQVIHNKSNEGPKAKPFWIRRQEMDFDRFIPALTAGAQSHMKALGALYEWFFKNGNAPFSASRILDNADTRAQIWAGLSVSRNAARETIQRAQDEGDLVNPAVGKDGAKHSPHTLWVFRQEFEPNPM